MSGGDDAGVRDKQNFLYAQTAGQLSDLLNTSRVVNDAGARLQLEQIRCNGILHGE